MAKKPRVSQQVALDTDSNSSTLDLYADVIDDLEKSTGLASQDNVNRIRISTGLGAMDIILGGGLCAGGWYTFFGGEQSSKSTLASTQLVAAAMNPGVPVRAYWDYEGSFSPDYIHNISKAMGFKGRLDDLFGLLDSKTGKYAKTPLIRLYQDTVGERFFDYLAKLERLLPDKLYKNGQWWLVYDVTKNNTHLKSKADANLLRRTNKYWIPTDNGDPQALLVCDSLPAMLPARLDEDDAGAGMAAQARMFSEQLKRVKGRMAPKRIIVMAINQLRLRPATMFGNPEYEPCGEAPKFFSDVRIRMASRSIPGGKGQIEEEPGINGGTDTYRYVHVRAHKNKLSVPGREGWLRIWVSNADGEACGYDPVYDSFWVLKETGLVSGTKNRISIAAFGLEKAKPMSWMQFKTLIIGSKQQMTSVFKSIGYTGKPFMLRSKIMAMVKSGKAEELFIEYRKAGGPKDGDNDDA